MRITRQNFFGSYFFPLLKFLVRLWSHERQSTAKALAPAKGYLPLVNPRQQKQRAGQSENMTPDNRQIANRRSPVAAELWTQVGLFRLLLRCPSSARKLVDCDI